MSLVNLSLKGFSLATLILTTSLLVTACGGSSSKEDVFEPLPEQVPETGQAGDGRLQDIVHYIRLESELPALAALLVHDGQIVEMAADGKRSISADVLVSNEDKWHIGSITKSMTSTLAAQLIEQGVIDWQTTISDVYPELVGIMKPSYESVTLEQLLSHTSGLVASIPSQNDYFSSSLPIETQRRNIVEEAVMQTPANEQGELLYSNIGYIVAGAMMEKLTATTWETLLDNNLFVPLAMNSSGYGAPDDQGDLNQPVGHTKSGSSWKAIVPSATNIADNPAALGPAGTVHASLSDMANYLSMHLAGARGESVNGLLSAQSFVKLHTAQTGGDYALGWGVDGEIITHNGSNTMWFANAIIHPEKNIAVFVVTNSADLDKTDSDAAKAISKLSTELFKRADATYSQ